MDALREKIADEALRHAAETGAEEARTVIVELNVPTRQIAFAQRRDDPRGLPRPTAVVAESDDQVLERETRTRALATLLRELVDGEPRHLAAARAFVVKLTGPQLASVAQSDLVKAISPNRKLA